MREGEEIRKFGVTNMNDHSSRSHTIFRIIIESCMKVEASNGSLQEDAGDVSFFKDYQKPIFSKMYFILLKIFINK